ncbi:MAG: glycine cleavage system protein GcvH [Clostridiaceae bacterium]|nr:glycine cleavage system protein GcvH [Clostridiaceae bacterium]
MNIPNSLLYSKSHEWVSDKRGTVKIGITDHAQEALGDIVFINLPAVGDTVTKGSSFADIESVKAVSEVYSPVSGTIVAVNADLADSPEKINEAPYDAWMIEVEVTDTEELLDAAAYAKVVEEEA